MVRARSTVERTDYLAATYTARELANMLAICEQHHSLWRRRAGRFEDALREIAGGGWNATGCVAVAKTALERKRAESAAPERTERYEEADHG